MFCELEHNYDKFSHLNCVKRLDFKKVDKEIQIFKSNLKCIQKEEQIFEVCKAFLEGEFCKGYLDTFVAGMILVK